MKANLRALSQLSALLVTSVIMAACAQNNGAQAINTGDPSLDAKLGTAAIAGPVKASTIYFISTDHLYARSAPESAEGNIVGTLELNDQVQVVDPTKIGSNEFVKVRVVKSANGLSTTQEVYVSAKYFNSEATKAEPGSELASKVFVVTNIATEKVRVYLRCEPGEGCVNKLIFEQDVVSGEDEDGTRTDVGVYRVDNWVKFYETGPYPAWYRPGYPAVPKPGSDMSSWFSSSYMPGGKGDMRGAFGWYTLKVAPNPNGQWMHGTAGWGADKKSFIMFKNSFWSGILNLFTNIRSHGCTRIDNESIAYLRQFVPVGATYVKIYAKEGTRVANPPALHAPRATWNYIMTKNGYGQVNNHQKADRNEVLNAGTPRSEWIEEGSYEVDQYPNASTGDLYDIGDRNFRGVFLVDEGTVVGYQHPAGLSVAGYPDRMLPSYMISTNPSYVGASGRTSSGGSSSGTGSIGGGSQGGWNHSR